MAAVAVNLSLVVGFCNRQQQESLLNPTVAPTTQSLSLTDATFTSQNAFIAVITTFGIRLAGFLRKTISFGLLADAAA